MAKQLLISVMEDVIGEYILNISKENLKVAALRGKVKLENVQLDGDLIGSHVLGAVGLSGFGVLSCWARSVKIIVPLKNLEKQPTRFEIHGIHLLCVPLLPSTAHRRYGAGSAVDPRCSLRTRAKRSALARLERNFFHGRIQGEGPPTRRMRIAMKLAERQLRKSKAKWRSQRLKDGDLENDDAFSELESSMFGDATPDIPDNMFMPSKNSWVVKFREKMLRNLEVSMVDVHVRCEVSEGGLDFSHPGQRRARKQYCAENEMPAEHRAFSFGLTLDSFVVRSAFDGQSFSRADSSMSDDSSTGSSRQQSQTNSLASTSSWETQSKMADLNNVAFYWDDQPPLLLSESYILATNDHSLSPNRLQGRIAVAMEAMIAFQDPGESIRQSLMRSDAISPSRKGPFDNEPKLPHVYCCENFSAQMLFQLGDRNQPGPMTVTAEILPLTLDLQLRPNQFVQYNKLKSAMYSQQRFDTMLRQRPNLGPLSQPREWWKYVFACVTTSPNSRPWEDVVKIARSRTRYIELVKKKINQSSEGNGFHGGLKDEESFELLGIEDLLPIEALLTFHLLAMREIYWMRKEAGRDFFEKAEGEELEIDMKAQSKPRLINPFRRSKKSKPQQLLVDKNTDQNAFINSVNGSLTKEAVYAAIESRMGRKNWHNTFLLKDAKVSAVLIQLDERIIQLDLRATGEIRTFGPVRRDCLVDVIHFEIIDPQNRLANFTPHEISDRGKLLMFEEIHRQLCDADLSLTVDSAISAVDQDTHMEPPPLGVVCRLSATNDTNSMRLGISAHPATLVWSKPCMNAVAEFFSSPSVELQTEVYRQLRTVATPLARRALLALMSPRAFELRMNIAAPKVWFPVSGETSDGAVYFDAGKFLVSISKQELRTDTVWNLAARDIQMLFIRQSRGGHIRLGNISEKDTMSVIYPLQLNVDAILAERELELQLGNPTFAEMSLLPNAGPWRKLDVSISPICLNLVDAEILARAIGKWYASGLVRVKKRRDSNVVDVLPLNNEFASNENAGTLRRAVQITTSGVGILSVHVERFEMALEGHSKTNDGNSYCGRSSNTNDSHTEFKEAMVRTYVVELFDIHVGRLSQHGITRSNFLVSDIKIVRVMDVRGFDPLVSDHHPRDLPHCILVRLDKDYGTSEKSAATSRLSPLQRRGLDPSLQQGLSQSFEGRTSAGRSAAAEAISFLSVNFMHDQLLHLDEVEIDMDAIVLRVTPKTLKDCSKGFSKVMELAQVVTREMERKVHEEGRKARLDKLDTGGSSKNTTVRRDQTTDAGSNRVQVSSSDSSILFKITLHDMTLLAGRPLRLLDTGKSLGEAVATRFAVVQFNANALFMFQSVENGDGSGSKTLHASVDNLSASANTELGRLSPKVAPMIGPTAAEFRVVYATENLGSVVSQDVSMDCEALKASVTPNDIFIIKSVFDSIHQRLQKFVTTTTQVDDKSAALTPKPPRFLVSLIRFQKKGAGIATAIRFEVQHVCFVLLEAYQSKQGTRPLFDFRFSAFKGRFNGCMTTLSGECNASISVNHFNTELTGWESTVEPVNIDVCVEQMPDELSVNATTLESIATNVTTTMLKDYLKIDFSILKAREDDDNNASIRNVDVDPSTLTTIGLRRATERHSLVFRNNTGLDILVSSLVSNGSTCRGETNVLVEAGHEVSLDMNHPFDRFSRLPPSMLPKLEIRLAATASARVGEREPLGDLPVSDVGERSTFLYRLTPTAAKDHNDNTVVTLRSGRCSPDTVFSENSGVTNSEFAYYNAEPVVEWCMQNQRLRASITDCYSLPKGRDLLSSRTWSPGDELFGDPDQPLFVDILDLGESASMDDNDSFNLPKKVKTSTALPSQHSNWVKPYLKNDSPEWTDMTCILRMARDRVMLPDNNWIWLNDWTVDLSGTYGETTDCDGWEYEADFETFNRHRRFYQRGDSCRRRRWTRTRMIRPPPLADIRRPLVLAWETSCDSHDNFVVTARSHVTLHNNTSIDLAVFVSSPSWEETGLGVVNAGDSFPLPIEFATATYIQLGILREKSTNRTSTSKSHTSMSRRIMIVPTGYTSTSFIRTVMNIKRVHGSEVFMGIDADKSVHLLIQVTSVKGIVDVRIHPVLRIVNLLPCQLDCELGEIAEEVHDELRRVIGPKGRKVSSKELLVIDAGAEGKGHCVNPCLKPHISLRLPSYHWSSWHRIVNGNSSSNTWQPVDAEEEWHMKNGSSDADYADEFKSIVFFEPRGAGDPLNIIISVEMGHCPILRVYAQYWILDKTGFGCRFCDSFSDMLGASPDAETSRRSYLPKAEAKSTILREDKNIPGFQWAIGKDGMTLYFSRKEKIALSIECGTSGKGTVMETSVRSSWVSPLDVSNVIPKTIFSVDEYNGYRRFELAVSVNVCPSIFNRTKLITLYPRYQIVNLLGEDLIVVQDGWQKGKTCIKPQSSVPFHWERQYLPPRIRLGRQVSGAKDDILWTAGCIQLDKIGITSMRLPLETSEGSQPIVVQAEVRLATKEQSSAVVVAIWLTSEMSNALYVLRNYTSRTILCRQPLHDDVGEDDGNGTALVDCTGNSCITDGSLSNSKPFECGADFGPVIKAFLGFDVREEFVWVVPPGEKMFFGFDDPEKLHILEWTSVSNGSNRFDKRRKNAFVEIDAMGSFSTLPLEDGTEIRCQIGAEHSTKVVDFTEFGSRLGRKVLNRENMNKLRQGGKHYEEMLNSNMNSITDRYETYDEEDNVSFTVRISLPTISISVIDNGSSSAYGREILLAQLDSLALMFAQRAEGYHEMELILMSLQVDNHVQRSIHPVLVFCPKVDVDEPLLHLSAVRRLQPRSSSLAFRYVAIRLLDVEIYLDRRTAENIANFIQPLGKVQEDHHQDPNDWIIDVTRRMSQLYRQGNASTSADVDAIVSSAQWGRIYIEQLHLHPVRIGLTFTQEWMEWKPGAEGMMIFQFIRGMASIANAPLKFTSFVVGHVFESPQSLARVVVTHYSSQLTKQILGIVGSLAILGAPADFISNVGTGVRDFFYEPINGLVHGPAQFVEGLEVGTQSLARGVFVGVVRGAANVTEVVNSNLAGLTADDQFLDERKAHQRMLTDAMSRGETNRDFRDSLCLAGASVVRGVRSGAYGIWEQPAHYASKHGPIGFVKGVGKALVGVIVKPVVGVGDAAVLVMNHVSDATSDKQIIPKIPKRLRRALPRANKEKPFSVRIVPYDDAAAKAQQIVTGGESLDDVYIGHLNIPTHLIIASDQYLLAVDNRTREQWRASWEEISHFGRQANDNMRISVFGQTGLRSYVFEINDSVQFAVFRKLLVMQVNKMGNASSALAEGDHKSLHASLEDISNYDIPGIRVRQVKHVFGSSNNTRKRLNSGIKDEIDVIEQCFARVRKLDSHLQEFFKTLDEEAWLLINSWGQVFSGLSSRRCITASIINGTGFDIQIKSTKLVEGGSPCYSIPSKEFDSEQGVLRPGGVIIFFGWGVVPNLLQAGNVFMSIETNAFVSDFSDHKGRETYAETMPGYEVGFLEKSYDESGWWAKYWLLVSKTNEVLF